MAVSLPDWPAQYAPMACPACGRACFLVAQTVDGFARLLTSRWGCGCGVATETVEHVGFPRTRRLLVPGYDGGGVVPSPWAHGAHQVVASSEPPSEPEPEPAVEAVPVISGSVIGYRAWRLKDWRLYGTGVARAWVPGVNEATCDTGVERGYLPRHAAPAIGCNCGITALARFTHWVQAAVFGAIEAWSDESADGDGRFILHAAGFRAQFAKVVLLAIDPEWPVAKQAAVRALAHLHGADVCKHEHLEDAAKEHGQLVPDDMLEWAADGTH